MLIVDDFTISGGTLIAMADVLRSRRPTTSMRPFRTASVQGSGAADRRQPDQADVHHRHDRTACDALPHNITVVTVARLFAEAIHSIHDRTSVSQLFPDGPKQ